jgi:LUD domain
VINSVQAITEAGQLVVVSANGSQIGAISAGAETLILVVGSQKIVPNLDAAFQRIQAVRGRSATRNAGHPHGVDADSDPGAGVHLPAGRPCLGQGPGRSLNRLQLDRLN